jgi:hypothetical protein
MSAMTIQSCTTIRGVGVTGSKPFAPTTSPEHPYDPSERPKVGLRSREWRAAGQTEVECVREMARCLREILEGRAPK